MTPAAFGSALRSALSASGALLRRTAGVRRHLGTAALAAGGLDVRALRARWSMPRAGIAGAGAVVCIGPWRRSHRRSAVVGRCELLTARTRVSLMLRLQRRGAAMRIALGQPLFGVGQVTYA